MSDRDVNIPGATITRLVHDRAQIDQLESRLFGEIEQLGFPTSSQFAIRLAFEEAITNAFVHGNGGQSGTDITVEYAVHAERVCIAVEDRGTGFNPGKIPDPTLEENLHKPSGRGLMLIRSYMTKVWHNDAGNRLLMCYERPNVKG
ncbi:MAG: serine/threonine-protein kinase RsbW [Phycisphaerales bacterium]|jgi:serine/threonine-protein kinase RsbW